MFPTDSGNPLPRYRIPRRVMVGAAALAALIFVITLIAAAVTGGSRIADVRFEADPLALATGVVLIALALAQPVAAIVLVTASRAADLGDLGYLLLLTLAIHVLLSVPLSAWLGAPVWIGALAQIPTALALIIGVVAVARRARRLAVAPPLEVEVDADPTQWIEVPRLFPSHGYATAREWSREIGGELAERAPQLRRSVRAWRHRAQDAARRAGDVGGQSPVLWAFRLGDERLVLAGIEARHRDTLARQPFAHVVRSLAPTVGMLRAEGTEGPGPVPDAGAPAPSSPRVESRAVGVITHAGPRLLGTISFAGASALAERGDVILRVRLDSPADDDPETLDRLAAVAADLLAASRVA